MDIHESSRVYLLHYTTLILGRIHIQSARCRFRKIAVNYVWTCDKCSLRPDMPVIWRLHTFCLTMCLVTQNRWYSLNLQSETRSGFRSRSIILKLRFGICPALDRVQWRCIELQQRVTAATSLEEDSRKAAAISAEIPTKPTTACRGLPHGFTARTRPSACRTQQWNPQKFTGTFFLLRKILRKLPSQIPSLQWALLFRLKMRQDAQESPKKSQVELSKTSIQLFSMIHLDLFSLYGLWLVTRANRMKHF